MDFSYWLPLNARQTTLTLGYRRSETDYVFGGFEFTIGHRNSIAWLSENISCAKLNANDRGNLESSSNG